MKSLLKHLRDTLNGILTAILDSEHSHIPVLRGCVHLCNPQHFGIFTASLKTNSIESGCGLWVTLMVEKNVLE